MAQTAEQVMEKVRKGKQVAEILKLRPVGGVRGSHYGALYSTEWGKKTAYGLYETIVELVK